MSEEEKKAIEYWKRDISLYHYNTQLCSEHYAQIILNLIETQQKEISLLKDQLEYVKSEYEETIEHQQKEIEELKEEYNTKLLSNAGIYQLGFNDGIKTVEDKIKAKIEELEKEQENNRKSLYNAINILYFKEIDKISNRISVNMAVSDILQSLLEKE